VGLKVGVCAPIHFLAWETACELQSWHSPLLRCCRSKEERVNLSLGRVPSWCVLRAAVRPDLSKQDYCTMPPQDSPVKSRCSIPRNFALNMHLLGQERGQHVQGLGFDPCTTKQNPEHTHSYCPARDTSQQPAGAPALHTGTALCTHSACL
jgi:hypothetical protein